MGDLNQILLDKALTRDLIGDWKDDLPEKSKGGTKRSFHNRSSVVHTHDNHGTNRKNGDELPLSTITNSRYQFVALKDGDVKTEAGEDVDHEFPAEKRPRTSDWPLRSGNTGSEGPSRPRVALSDRYDTLNSTSLRPRQSVQPRPSKFVEGSMNDRASQRPHPAYIGVSEEPCEQFEAEQYAAFDGNWKKPHLNVSRSSTIFRFGKSVAAAFNLSSWKIWSKQQEDEDRPERRILTERQEKAEKVYRELKRTGQLKDYEYGAQNQVQDVHTQHKKLDSRVYLGNHAPTKNTACGVESKTVELDIDEKRYGRIFLNSPSRASLASSDSPASELSPSLGNSSSHLPELLEQANESSNGPQALRRLPSRKDLQKQQKLVKRVSDLEGKLEAARRQLAESLGESVPAQALGNNRSRFIPGALASLPSERLLGVYTSSEAEIDSNASAGVGKAISIDDRINVPVSNLKAHKSGTEGRIRTASRNLGTPGFEDILVGSSKSVRCRNNQNSDLQMAEEDQTGQAVQAASQEASTSLIPSSQPTKKRKSMGPATAEDVKNYSPAPNSDGYNSPEAPKTPLLKRKPGRPRKLQKVDPEAKSLKVESIESKHLVPGSFMEENDSAPSRGRKTRSPKNERKAPPSITTSRIPRQGRRSNSPPPMSSAGTKYAGQEAKSTRDALHDDQGQNFVSIVPSAEVPPVPRIPGVGMAKVLTKAIPGSKKSPRHNRETDTHDDQTEPEVSNADSEKLKAKAKPSFEWPEDVF